MSTPSPSALPTLALSALVCLLLGANFTADTPAETVIGGVPAPLAERLQQDGFVMVEDVGGSGPNSFLLALVQFDKPRERVRELLRQAERQPEYRPELVSAKTIQEIPEGRIDEQRLKILFVRLTYRLRYHDDPATRRITWTLDEDFDNDIARMDGFWELYQFEESPGMTLGRFGSTVDVGKGVPGFVQKGLSRKTVREYVENVRLWVDSDGAWRH
jgi:hypothetical protein